MLRVRFPSVAPSTRRLLKYQSLKKIEQLVPKGHIAIYVGEEEKTRYVVPIAYLNHPAFEQLLKRAEEEFGYSHPMGGLTIPCKEEEFLALACQLNSS